MILDIIYIPIFILLAMQFPKLLLEENEYTYYPILKKLALFHFLLGIAFFFTTNNGGGDAWGYWLGPKTMSYSQFLTTIQGGEGTEFMRAFNYIPANMMGMSFL